MSNVLEIYCDASIKTFNNGRTFGCAGAICPEFNTQKLQILPDATNNKSEITAIYLAVLLAKEMIDTYGDRNIIIYSDSKISVFGLREWIDNWKNNTVDGVMYNSSNIPVANQYIFLKVFNYLKENKMSITLLHQKGHVNNANDIENASRVFLNSNGFEISADKARDISIYNNKIDTITRVKLEMIDPNQYQIITNSNPLARYTLPSNYKILIHGGDYGFNN